MNILITTGLYPPEIGGPATYTKALEAHLPAHGFSVSVLPFNTVRHMPKIIRHITYFLKTLLMARNADVVFAQDSVSVGLPSLYAAKILGKKFFVRLGGDYAWEQGRLRFGVMDDIDTFACGHTTYGRDVRFLKWIQTHVARAAEKISVQSEHMKKIVSCWGISKEKISVVPNGFGAEVFYTKNAESPLPLERPAAVSAGRLVPWKGFGELICQVPTILESIPDFHLYIIGDGPEEKNLQFLAKENGVEDRVHFEGKKDKKDLMRYLSSANVFVLNTQYEGLSNQLLEAYAADTPIVTTNVCSNSEVVVDGVTGLLVTPHDGPALTTAILKILDDSSLSASFVKNGREKLKEFSMENMIEKSVRFLK